MGEENVIAPIDASGIERKTAAAIRDEILEFVSDDRRPRFWGYYADYDWVVFCWLFGRMIDLPKHFPRYCRDLKQWADQLRAPKFTLKQSDEHNALSDARWNSALYDYLEKFSST